MMATRHRAAHKRGPQFSLFLIRQNIAGHFCLPLSSVNVQLALDVDSLLPRKADFSDGGDV